MDVPMHKQRCAACGGQLERGVLQAAKAGSTFTFVRTGEPKPRPLNPIKAILQIWREISGAEDLPLEAFRCVRCGRVELYAGEGEISGA